MWTSRRGKLLQNPSLPLILYDRVSAVIRLAVVAALLVLQLSIDLRDRVLETFSPSRFAAGVLQIVKPLSDSPCGDLGEIEVQLLVL